MWIWENTLVSITAKQAENILSPLYSTHRRGHGLGWVWLGQKFLTVACYHSWWTIICLRWSKAVEQSSSSYLLIPP